MRHLIDDLLEYSRVETKGKEFAMVDMNAVMEKTLTILKSPIEAEQHQVSKWAPFPTSLLTKPRWSR